MPGPDPDRGGCHTEDADDDEDDDDDDTADE